MDHFIYFHGYSAKIDSSLYNNEYLNRKYQVICLDINFGNNFYDESMKIYNYLLNNVKYENSILVGHSLGSVILISIVYKYLIYLRKKPKKIILLAPAITLETDIDYGLSYSDLQKLTTNRLHLNTFMLFKPLIDIFPPGFINNMFSTDIAWKMMIVDTFTKRDDLMFNIFDSVFNVNNDYLWAAKHKTAVFNSIRPYPKKNNLINDLFKLFNKNGLYINIIHAEDDSLITILNSKELASYHDNIKLYIIKKELKYGHFPYKSMLYFV
jgi:pimeloyl-ACP methyl ester carboxylesterase